MSDATGDPDALEPADEALGEELRRLRPVPRPAFRGTLQRRLVSLDPGYGPRPDNLRAMVGVRVAAGLLLLIIGALIALALS